MPLDKPDLYGHLVPDARRIRDLILCRLSDQISDACWEAHLSEEPGLRDAWETHSEARRRLAFHPALTAPYDAGYTRAERKLRLLSAGTLFACAMTGFALAEFDVGGVWKLSALMGAFSFFSFIVTLPLTLCWKSGGRRL